MKFKAAKIIPVLLAASMCFSLAGGCKKDKENGHTHSYVYTQKDEENHTKTCKDCDEVNETEKHEYDNDSDKTCNKCGYERTITPAGPSGGTGDTFDGKIYVVGDSTVCAFPDEADKLYMPRYGYGTQLAEYLNITSDQVVNLALSGRSSKSFTYGLDIDPANKIASVTGDKSCYEYLTSNISAGDYLVIGFGHNDEKSDNPDRFTTATGDKDTAGSFQNSLYTNYVKMAADKGATPILCTPIARYDASGNYTGDKIHNTANGDYAKAIKDLGAATKTTVVDLTTLTKEECLKDNAAAEMFFHHSTYSGEKPDEVPAGLDSTHLNKYGAMMVAYKFAEAIAASDCTLKAFVKANIAMPADYTIAIVDSYVKSDYTPFNKETNESQNLVGDWYKTCMGELGGASLTPFTITNTGSDSFTITTTGGKGKIEGKQDGFAAVFMQIPANKNFEATAHVKVNTMGSEKQAAFGMMLRDDIYINYTAKDGLVLNSNYLAAGALTNDGAATTAIFRRVNTTLTKSGNTADVAANSEYDIKIKRVGQEVELTFGEATETVTDVALTAVDHDYDYICLFAIRNFAVTFTNVKVEFTGDSQGA